MRLTIIVAMTRDGIIGSSNDLPWHLPEDLRLFRATTTGHPIIMGRKTHESIGKALPRRTNIVISRTLPPREDIVVARSLDEALAIASREDETAFIIGGSSIYAEALPVADELLVSWVYEDHRGDVRFPVVDWSAWTLTEESEHEGFTRRRYRRTHP